MRLIAFSDGHIGEYLEGRIDPYQGLNTRLLDTLNVWDWVLDLAITQKADGVIFMGDRFKPHRPPTWMRDLADQRVAKFQDAHMPLVCLLGNHDMYDKGGRWNCYGGVKVWAASEGTSPVWVFDQPGALDFCGTCLYFLPYGSPGESIEFSDLNPDGSNILFFHDDVRNVSNYGHHIAEHGLAQATIDRPEFALVLGGHVHLRQELPFTHTSAYHIGSPLERLQDGDQGPKGAFIIDADNGSIGIEFIESPMPKIIRASVSWTGDIADIWTQVPAVAENIVQLVVTHMADVPKNLRRDVVKQLWDRHAAGVDVRLQTEFMADRVAMQDKAAQIGTGLPLEEEAVEYVRTITEDPELALLTKQVIERSCTSTH